MLDLFSLRRSSLAKTVSIVIVCSIGLVGCGTQQQTGQLLGGLGGGVLVGVLGKQVGGREGAIVGATVGALAGVLIGGEIGRQLDEEDRKRAAAASIAAIKKSEAMGGKAATAAWSSEKNTGVSGSARAVAVADPKPPVRRPKTQPESTESSGVLGTLRDAVGMSETSSKPSSQTQAGSVDQASAKPSSTQTIVEARRCFRVDETAQIPGKQELSQQTVYCRQGDKYVPV